MRSRVDIVGRVVGKWTVLSFAEIRDGRSIYVCQCECGTVKKVLASSLLYGASASCGCTRRKVGATWKEHTLRVAERVLSSGEKRCSVCSETLPLVAFRTSKRTACGRRSACKRCETTAKHKLKYGVGLDEKRLMIAAQGGHCANRGCGALVDEKSHTDHCHRTGVVRGVLCRPCNTAMGFLGDSPVRISGLAEYARKWMQLKMVR